MTLNIEFGSGSDREETNHEYDRFPEVISGFALNRDSISAIPVSGHAVDPRTPTCKVGPGF